MKLNKLLMVGAALFITGAMDTAQAAERMSIHEVNSFVTRMTNAVNSVDTNITAAFLERSLADSASFSDTVNTAVVDGRFINAWGAYGYSPYYRYPHGYVSYVQPTSFNAIGKDAKINKIINKKNTIPRYHTSMNIIGTRMAANGTSAVLDVSLREYGMSYALAPYGAYHGQKLQHANARCSLHLSKHHGSVMLTKMDCNTVKAAPWL